MLRCYYYKLKDQKGKVTGVIETEKKKENQRMRKTGERKEVK